MSLTVKGVHGELVTVPYTEDPQKLLSWYSEVSKVPFEFCRMTQCSKPVRQVAKSTNVVVSLRINGGKGGFGSLLRGQGMFARVDNFEACRDLEGRRIRHVNDEVRLQRWRETKEEPKETIAPTPKAPRKTDPEYKKAVKEGVSRIKSAVAVGMKRWAETNLQVPQKKPKAE